MYERYYHPAKPDPVETAALLLRAEWKKHALERLRLKSFETEVEKLETNVADRATWQRAVRDEKLKLGID